MSASKVETTSNLDVHAMQTVATACMFLAGKVEETPRPLKDVILVSYEIIHKKDPAAIQKIKQKVLFLFLFLPVPNCQQCLTSSNKFFYKKFCLNVQLWCN